MDEYIRGWRQVEAILIFFKCLIKGNFLCAKRELHIMTGFAKPYGVKFHPMFWESCKDVGLSEDEIDDLRRKLDPEYKGRYYLEKCKTISLHDEDEE